MYCFFLLGWGGRGWDGFEGGDGDGGGEGEGNGGFVCALHLHLYSLRVLGLSASLCCVVLLRPFSLLCAWMLGREKTLLFLTGNEALTNM